MLIVKVISNISISFLKITIALIPHVAFLFTHLGRLQDLQKLYSLQLCAQKSYKFHQTIRNISECARPYVRTASRGFIKSNNDSALKTLRADTIKRNTNNTAVKTKLLNKVWLVHASTSSLVMACLEPTIIPLQSVPCAELVFITFEGK